MQKSSKYDKVIVLEHSYHLESLTVWYKVFTFQRAMMVFAFGFSEFTVKVGWLRSVFC